MDDEPLCSVTIRSYKALIIALICIDLLFDKHNFFLSKFNFGKHLKQEEEI